MTPMKSSIACALVAFAATAAANPTTTTTKQSAGKVGKKAPVMMNPEQVTWGEAPPHLPKGAQLAVMFGDPTKKGTFTVRLKFPDGYKVAPHWHSNDEELTIISGTLVMRAGDSPTSEAHAITTGGYHFQPGKVHHSAEARGETIVQIHSTGPFDIHYVNPDDHPNPEAKKPAKTAKR